MIVGTAAVDLFLPACGSLKAKRRIVKGLRERVRRKYNVSVAEVDYLDKWQRATLGIAVVTNDTRFADRVLAGVIREIERDPTLDVLSVSVEMR